jgi:hypothetical protein
MFCLTGCDPKDTLELRGTVVGYPRNSCRAEIFVKMTFDVSLSRQSWGSWQSTLRPV